MDRARARARTRARVLTIMIERFRELELLSSKICYTFPSGPLESLERISSIILS